MPMLTANHLKSPARKISRENSMTGKLDNQALDLLYRAARTRNAWTEQPVTEQQLRELYDLLKFGPTSGKCCPARFVWVRSAEGKHRLAALAAPTNAPKILAAPVTVIVGYDLDFAEQLPKLFPVRGKDMQAYYSDPLVAQTTAFRNGSLQGAYLIIAARNGTGLRSDVWLQQRGGGFRILCRYTHQIQFHLLYRVRIE
jgi:3-hydroxypropanoate dehydrogenase